MGFSAKGLSKAKETLDVLKMTPSERQAYERYQEQLHYEASMYESTYVVDKAEGFTEGHAQGRAEGIDTANQQTVIRAYQQGMTIEAIAKITGLSVAAVQTILREQGVE